jgi:hypothetical protein
LGRGQKSLLVKWTTGCYISGCVLSMGNAMKSLAQHLHRCALDRLGCVSISGVRTSLFIALANPLRLSCNARNATFYNTAMGLIAISFLQKHLPILPFIGFALLHVTSSDIKWYV